MPRFAANLTMLFNEVPFLERFERARKDHAPGQIGVTAPQLAADEIAEAAETEADRHQRRDPHIRNRRDSRRLDQVRNPRSRRLRKFDLRFKVGPSQIAFEPRRCRFGFGNDGFGFDKDGNEPCREAAQNQKDHHQPPANKPPAWGDRRR